MAMYLYVSSIIPSKERKRLLGQLPGQLHPTPPFSLLDMVVCFLAYHLIRTSDHRNPSYLQVRIRSPLLPALSFSSLLGSFLYLFAKRRRSGGWWQGYVCVQYIYKDQPQTLRGGATSHFKSETSHHITHTIKKKRVRHASRLHV